MSSMSSSNGAHTLADQEDAGGSSWFDLNADAPPQPVHSDAGMTQRMLPVSRPDLDHPDLLPASVFGTETDLVYEEEPSPRSLFEPVVQPEALVDDFGSPSDYSSSSYSAPSSSDYAASDYSSSPDYSPSDYSPSSSDYAQSSASDYSSSLSPSDFGSPSDFASSDYSSPSADFTPADFDQAPERTETTEEFFNAPRPVRVRTGVDGQGTQSMPAMSPVAEPESGLDVAAGPFGPGSALPNPDGSAPSQDFRIKARTSSMVFHTESSPFYERLEPQVWFRDAEEAQRAGFTSWERPRGW
jgi:hypothetical protein